MRIDEVGQKALKHLSWGMLERQPGYYLLTQGSEIDFGNAGTREMVSASDQDSARESEHRVP